MCFDTANIIKKQPTNFPLEYKLDLIERIEKTAIADVDWVKSSRAMYGEFYGTKYFMNTDGDEISWNPLVVDLRIILTASAKTGDTLVRGTNGTGGSKGLEFFELKEYTPEELGQQVKEWTNEQRDAKAAPDRQ